jgi:hypothetical protein
MARAAHWMIMGQVMIESRFFSLHALVPPNRIKQHKHHRGEELVKLQTKNIHLID